MTHGKLLVEERAKGVQPLSEAPAEGWKWIGWLGVLLAVVGLGDFVLAWYPLRFGVAEWEFGTVASTFAGLPLVTMGFAALLASGLARGRGWLVRLMGWWLVLFGVVVLAALVVFLTDVPIALRAVTGDAALGIKKAIAKTTMLGVVFSAAYVVSGASALRYLGRHRKATHG